jgi:hypothetical protein
MITDTDKAGHTICDANDLYIWHVVKFNNVFTRKLIWSILVKSTITEDTEKHIYTSNFTIMCTKKELKKSAFNSS